MHSSVYVHVVNGQRLKFNTVNGQSLDNQHGRRSKRRKELIAAVTTESKGVTPCPGPNHWFTSCWANNHFVK